MMILFMSLLTIVSSLLNGIEAEDSNNYTYTGESEEEKGVDSEEGGLKFAATPPEIQPFRITGVKVVFPFTLQPPPNRSRITPAKDGGDTINFLIPVNPAPSGGGGKNETPIINPKEKQEENPPKLLNGIIMGFTTPLALTCLTLNILIVVFYKDEAKKVVPFLYLVNAINDTILAGGVLIQMLIFIPQIWSSEDVVPGILSEVSYIIVGVAVRVSTFVNMILCVVRAVNIVQPFYRIRKLHVGICISIWVFIWLILAICDVVWFERNTGVRNGLYAMKSLVLKPEMGFSPLKTVFENSLSNLVEIVILFVPVFFVPVVILVVSTVIQVHTLYTRRRITTDPTPGKSSTNQRASITILILSLIFVLCNLTSIVIWMVVYWGYLRSTTVKRVTWVQLGLFYFSGTVMFLVSSTLTPLVLVMRGDASRGVSQYFSAIVSRISSRSEKGAVEKRELVTMTSTDAR